MPILVGILEQGFIYGIMALGIYISYKILNFPDLTVDGTFPLGAAFRNVPCQRSRAGADSGQRPVF